MGLRDEVGRLIGKSAKGDHGHDSTHHQTPEAERARDVARYRYLLRVASAERLEQAHSEAFRALPREQRERLFLRLCHDLPEEDRPISSSPAELAHAAVVAQEADPGYLVRMLRRPGYGVTEGHFVPSEAHRSGGLLFAESVLDQVAARTVGSWIASEALAGFDRSPEAAQLSASVFVRPAAPETGFGALLSGGNGAV
jgi:hypothetical protein